jgi:hypothetical protein
VAIRRVVAGERAAVERAVGALVLGAEEALVGAVLAIGDGVAEAIHGDALGLLEQGVARQAGIFAGGTGQRRTWGIG